MKTATLYLEPPENTIISDICYISSCVWKGIQRLFKILTGVVNQYDGVIKSTQVALSAMQIHAYVTGNPLNPKTEKVFESVNTLYLPPILSLPKTLFGKVNNRAIKNIDQIKKALSTALVSEWVLSEVQAKKIAQEQIEKLQDLRAPNLTPDICVNTLEENLREVCPEGKDAKSITTELNNQGVKFDLQWGWYVRYFVQRLQDFIFEIVNVQTLLVCLREWGVNIAAAAEFLGQFAVFRFMADLVLDVVMAFTTISGYTCMLFLAIWDIVVAATVEQRILAIWTAVIATAEIVRNALSIVPINKLFYLSWAIFTKGIGFLKVFYTESIK